MQLSDRSLSADEFKQQFKNAYRWQHDFVGEDFPDADEAECVYLITDIDDSSALLYNYVYGNADGEFGELGGNTLVFDNWEDAANRLMEFETGEEMTDWHRQVTRFARVPK